MFLWVVEHTCADAELTLFHFEDRVVDTSLAAMPERIVVSQLFERHRHISQSCVHLHHCITAGEREYLGMRPTYACQGECVVFDSLYIGIRTLVYSVILLLWVSKKRR